MCGVVMIGTTEYEEESYWKFLGAGESSAGVHGQTHVIKDGLARRLDGSRLPMSWKIRNKSWLNLKRILLLIWTCYPFR